MAEQAANTPNNAKKIGRASDLARIEQIFNSQLTLTEFEKALVRERYLNPSISLEELGAKFGGLAKSTIHGHLKKSRVQAALARINADVISQIQAMHLLAAKNYLKFLKSEPSDDDEIGRKIQFEASKDILHAPLTSPAALPAGPRELPRFTEE